MIQMQNSIVTQQEHKISITMHQPHPQQNCFCFNSNNMLCSTAVYLYKLYLYKVS